MTYHLRTAWTLLALLLILGQAAATAHAYSHDLAAPVDPGCASCVHAGQLGTGASDTLPAICAVPAAEIFDSAYVDMPVSADSCAPRQRGPPFPV